MVLLFFLVLLIPESLVICRKLYIHLSNTLNLISKFQVISWWFLLMNLIWTDSNLESICTSSNVVYLQNIKQAFISSWAVKSFHLTASKAVRTLADFVKNIVTVCIKINHIRFVSTTSTLYRKGSVVGFFDCLILIVWNIFPTQKHGYYIS